MSERTKGFIWLVGLIILLTISVITLNFRKDKISEEAINKTINEKTEDITNSKNQANTIETEGNKIIEVSSKNFDEEVIKSDKKVLIDFYATWCEPCKTLKPVLEEISKENDNIKIVEIDVDKCQDLAMKYGISAMPTLIVIENGKEVKRSIGAIPKDRVLKLLEQ